MSGLNDYIMRHAEAYADGFASLHHTYKAALEAQVVSHDDLYLLGVLNGANICTSAKECERGSLGLMEEASEATKNRADMIAANLLEITVAELAARATSTWEKLTEFQNAQLKPK